MKLRHAIALLLIGCGEQASGGGKVDWVTDYDAGMEKAKAENKPVMLVFTAEW